MKRFTVKLELKQLVLLAILLALNLLAAKLTFGSDVAKISPSFVPGSLIGMVGGPLWAGVVLALGDLISSMTSGAAYFPGFTLSALIVGIIYGLFFYKKSLDVRRWQDWLYTFVAIACVMLVQSAFFNTLWVTLMMPQPSFAIFWHILGIRLLLLVQIPIKTAIIMLVIPALQSIKQVNRALL